jgi:DNA ligase-1
LPFQETVKRKRKYQVEAVAQEFPLKLYLFDVLYCDGESFLAVSHDVRRKKLEKLLANKKIITQGVLLLIQEKKITGAQELDDYFEQNITAGLEGVVVKRPDALYQAGKRNFNWIKLKRKESGSLDDTIDCVILGYYAGQGKRASFGIGALLVGVYNEKIDCFQTVAKIGTGLTDSEWRAQKETCDTYKIIDKPHNVDCRKELYPDVWVTPTLVCMIRADEITRSPMHTAGRTEDHAGFALRFPRIMGYRPDKKAEQATSVNELKRLYTLQYKSAS